MASSMGLLLVQACRSIQAMRMAASFCPIGVALLPKPLAEIVSSSGVLSPPNAYT
jgi:hypothetical protein